MFGRSQISIKYFIFIVLFLRSNSVSVFPITISGQVLHLAFDSNTRP